MHVLHTRARISMQQTVTAITERASIQQAVVTGVCMHYTSSGSRATFTLAA
jgi:hypothetical protein